MQVNRISFLSFLFIISFYSPIQPYDSSVQINNHAQEWSSLYIDHMNTQEIQATAHFLYILYANALVDTEIQRLHSPFIKLSQIARNNLSNPNNPNAELAQLNILTTRLLSLIKARALYTKMLHESFNALNSNKIDIIENCLKDLQLHASDMLHSWAQENASEFATHLEKSAKTIFECEKSMSFASNMHKSLSAGILPFVVAEEHKPLAIINTVLESIPTFMHTADAALNSMNGLSHRAMETICLGTEIYKNHYQTIHNIIMQDSFDKNYATMLGSKYILLPDEYNSLLPEPNDVLKHMLEITHIAEQEYEAE